jgi:hypothetical protein
LEGKSIFFKKKLDILFFWCFNPICII